MTKLDLDKDSVIGISALLVHAAKLMKFTLIMKKI